MKGCSSDKIANNTTSSVVTGRNRFVSSVTLPNIQREEISLSFVIEKRRLSRTLGNQCAARSAHLQGLGHQIGVSHPIIIIDPESSTRFSCPEISMET